MPETDDAQRLTPQEVEETFKRAGLNDPAMRQYYERLAQMQPQEPRPVWLRTSIHSSDVLITD